MKRLFFIPILITFLFISNESEAQDYKLSAGARIGTYFAGSVKSFISENAAVEGVVGISRTGGQSLLSLGGYYQLHYRLSENVPTLNWYFGGGVFAALGNDDIESTIALSGVIGVEYSFEDTPINIFLDALPYYNIVGGSNFDTEASIGVRFILNR